MKKTLSVLTAIGIVLGMSGMAMAATATGTMTTSATLENSCTVSAATMTFAGFAALSSTADQTTDTAGSLEIACTTGVSPTIFSDSTRVMTGPATATVAFNLSQTSGAAADDLPLLTGVAEAIAGYTSTGSPIAVPLYGKILAANFGSLAAGAYTKDITVSVNY